ncbi:cellobiohydrolase 1 [Tricharina praecox]|uniref:cellobiohydrolase 1 n=1 Tax=Tricharina praecox TaxID=43433 RepID=UPI002220919E|nr:cellobiohydrolase 1 [Tricharina praecox]KAI5851957.1 cellobiohydrolase 1 [Tricharina praecox]
MQISATTLISLSLLAVASAQNVGTLTAETHPKLTWQKCAAGGTCTNQAGSIVLDANWRWLHTNSGSTNCYTGSAWDATLCPDPVTCATNCAVDGANYSGTYGITTSGNALTEKFVTKASTGTNVGSRVYLMDTTDTKYELFYLKNKEFTFDVDVSKLGCGLNGALYFVEMDADGGLSKFPTNKAGAKYGTGYCDAQCPHDIKFINGEANVIDWNPSATDANSGGGRYGTCCPEMDIWEANSISNAYTPHPCTTDGQYRCDGTECGDGDDRYAGVCDKDGCDINPYRMGNLNFYGPGSSNTLNTNTKMTVVTQFVTADGTDTGTLTEIRRKWVQNGVVIDNKTVNIPGVTGNSITDSFCAAQKSVFGDTNDYSIKGGMAAMGESLGRGHVLVMSIWADYAVNMLWLDSNWPLEKPATDPGVARGTCATTSGNPDDVIADAPDSQVTYSNIRFGPIGSTYGSTTTTPSGVSSAAPAASSTAAAGGTIAKYSQCGGLNWSGSGTCVSGTTCSVINAYYHQCFNFLPRRLQLVAASERELHLRCPLKLQSQFPSDQASYETALKKRPRDHLRDYHLSCW